MTSSLRSKLRSPMTSSTGARALDFDFVDRVRVIGSSRLGCFRMLRFDDNTCSVEMFVGRL